MVVIGPIVIGAIFIVMTYLVPDSKGESGLPRILAGVRRGRDMVIARRIAFSRAARLQRARLALDPFQLDPAELDGLDHLNGSWLHEVAGSEIARLVAALSATGADPDNPGRDRALACYDAAALLAAERDDRLDLLGAVVLAREGQTALAHRDPLPLPACQVHPLHGSAIRRPSPRAASPSAQAARGVCRMQQMLHVGA